MTVYIDLLILLNFLTDFLLLLGTNRLAGFPSHYPRVLAASAFGALYSGLCVTESLRFLSHPLWYLISLGILSAIAFGLNLTALRRGALFLLLSLSLGGMASALHQSRFLLLILDAGLLFFLSRTAFGGQHIGSEYIPITVHHNGKDYRFTALRDTGNQLKDPLTGSPVIVISPQWAERLAGLSPYDLSHPMETIVSGRLPGLRLVPYSSIGNGSGMLLALGFPEVTQGRTTGPALIAFAPEGLGQSTAYQALTGGI